jgi:hypothetical protein
MLGVLRIWFVFFGPIDLNSEVPLLLRQGDDRLTHLASSSCNGDAHDLVAQ